jgi:hypothetical protein
MNLELHSVYFSRRALEERNAAAEVPNPLTAEKHLFMAAHYERLAKLNRLQKQA